MNTVTVEKPRNFKQINCPQCNSTNIIKNGRRRDRQRYKCKDCNRHFQETNNLSGDRQQNSQKSNLKTKKTQLPDKALILLTAHRSGSTWLSDAIRCHPFVEYSSQALLYQELGINGRRYPVDLSNCADGVYEIEVQSGVWNKIPRFDVSTDLPASLQEVTQKIYAIEKCHPCFFNFDTQVFFDKIEHLKNLGTEVKLVYLVREPKSLITSFMNYQQRKPAWYRNLGGEQLVLFIEQTYQYVHQISQQLPGVILDYGDVKTNLPQVLLTIYRQLWDNLNSLETELASKVSDLAIKYTDRQQRFKQINSPFLGTEEGTIAGGDRNFSEFFNNHQALIERCYLAYKLVLENRESKFVSK
ncbi:MAG: hypothetical protein ACFCU5_20750 [Pleurocapsa sp.]